MRKIYKRYALFIGMIVPSRHYSRHSVLSNGGSIMKRFFLLLLTLAGSFAWAARPLSIAVNNHSRETNAFTPDTIPWGPAPPVVRPGAQFAVLEGDPTASTGDFTIRLKMPDGFRIDPHFHPRRENVTIISGTFKVGMGDDFEVKKMQAFT